MPPSKPELRRAMRERLKTLERREEKSRALCEALAEHRSYREAKTVALFDAMAVEPHVALLWSIAPRRFFYPRVEGVELRLHEVRAVEELRSGAAGARYREPAPEAGGIVEASEVDVILVPGVAFTRSGLRLGRGGGHYDRLLARAGARPVKIGVCFEVQLVETLPVEAHDVRLDAVVTELGFGGR
jgi:5-formyltetrahydrofolate cyclo-ligase